eukprot:TRINITY_DN29529_c0_g1_i1.p1 TRINITY_DN29529_c0_g1~~TRINITY_DN29529_c0_g1_i1.p1  ORF type:complete len:358 (+),score=78.08 TRINITY_DN29529_c0_g1_i1:68-1141(+)
MDGAAGGGGEGDCEGRAGALRRYVANGLPGCTAYDRVMDTRVKAAQDGLTAIEFLSHRVAGDVGWEVAAVEGRLRLRTRDSVLVLSAEDLHSVTVRAGDVLQHTVRGHIEPAVNGAVDVLHVDASVVAVFKPAPLPVHRGGRYTRNTLVNLCERAWPDLAPLLPAHRLDADTSGVMLLARNRRSCAALQCSFRDRVVRKVYVAETCAISSLADRWVCDAPLSHDAGPQKDALTAFRVVVRDTGRSTSLLLAEPASGRTHQVRLHCCSSAAAIVGDSLYEGPTSVSTRAAAAGSGALHLHCAAVHLPHPTPGAAPLLIKSGPPPWLQPQDADSVSAAVAAALAEPPYRSETERVAAVS